MTVTTLPHYDELFKVAGQFNYAVVAEGVLYVYRDALETVKSLANDFQEVEKTIYAVSASGDLIPVAGLGVDEPEDI